jgi:hypothetical protein
MQPLPGTLCISLHSIKSTHGPQSTRIPRVVEMKKIEWHFPRNRVPRVLPSSSLPRGLLAPWVPPPTRKAPNSHRSPRSHRGCRICTLCTATCRSWRPRSCSRWTAGRLGDLKEARSSTIRARGSGLSPLTINPSHICASMDWGWETNRGLDRALFRLLTITTSRVRLSLKDKNKCRCHSIPSH